MDEGLESEVDLFLPLLVKKPKMLLDLSVLGDPQNALLFTGEIGICFNPSSNVFNLSLNFSCNLVKLQQKMRECPFVYKKEKVTFMYSPP